MSNTYISSTSLDYFDLKDSLKTFMKSQDQFKDYDFDGSNLNQLLSILSYNSALMAFYLNMVASELNIDTAVLRESIVSEAKTLNYTPSSKTSARADVTVTITPSDDPGSIVLPKDYKFYSATDNKTLSFVTINDTIIQKKQFGVYTANITIYEGEIVNEYFVADTSLSVNGFTKYNNRYIIQSENIDKTSIEVFVKEDGNTSTTEVQYTYAENLYGLDANDKVFFIYGYAKNQYEIGFGNGSIGFPLKNNAIVRVKYRDTVGPLGNDLSSFSRTATVSGYSSISATTTTKSYGGRERESEESIKFAAPKYYQTQNRAVTASDYEIIVKKEYPQFQSVHAYGGEETGQYGKVFMSVKPYGNVNYISDSLKRQIERRLKSLYTTREVNIVDPDFFYVKIDTQVYYNLSNLNDTAESIKSNILTNLINVNNTSLAAFDADLRYSKIVKLIDDTSTAIISNDTDIQMVKKWNPITGRSQSIKIEFGNQLQQIETPSDTYKTYLQSNPFTHSPIVYSNSFNYRFNDVVYNCILRDDSLGNIILQYTNETTGEATKLGGFIGTVNYTTGVVNITLANVASYTNSIRVYAKTLEKDLFVNKNKYLTISGDDINITMKVSDV